MQPGLQEGPLTNLLSLSCPLTAESVWPRDHTAPCELNSSLLYLNQGLWGFIGNRAEFSHKKHFRDVHFRGSSRLSQRIWQLVVYLTQGNLMGSKLQRDMSGQWFFNSLNGGDLSAIWSETPFSYRSWEGPCRAQSWERATQTFIAAGDVRYDCGWRMG